MLPDLAPGISGKITKMPGVTLTVTDRCVGCGTCEEVCFVHAITVDDHAVITEACRGCGRCVEVCPQKAIEISIEGDFIKESIDRIAQLVDVT